MSKHKNHFTSTDKVKNNEIMLLRNITKTFLSGKILANNKITLSFKRGNIHALVGENGSGKSTLMNILFGLYKQDSGDIFINGEVVNMYSSGAAAKHKIGMVHQHFHLVDNFSVINNILIGQENPKIDPSVKDKLIEEYNATLSTYKDELSTLSLEDKKIVKKLEANYKKQGTLIYKHNITKSDLDFVQRSLRSGDYKGRKEKRLKKEESLINKFNNEKDKLRDLKNQQKNLQSLNNEVKKTFNLFTKSEKARKMAYGDKITSFSIINQKKAINKFNLLTEKYDLFIDPNKKVSKLSIGERQTVEILKVLWQDKDIIVLDEPTATLSIREIKSLMSTIRKLKKEGKTIIFISHKLEEVKTISDEISVLIKGELIETVKNTENLSIKQLSKMMVGKDIEFKYNKSTPTKDITLKVENLSYKTPSGFTALIDVSFEVKKGEIFGFAGIEGNGQEEAFNIISGIAKAYKGKITFENKTIVDVSKKFELPIKERIKFMSHSPIDRRKFGIVPDETLKFNSILSTYSNFENAKYYTRRFKREDALKEEYKGNIDQLNDLNENLRASELNEKPNPTERKAIKVLKSSISKLEKRQTAITNSIPGINYMMDTSSTTQRTNDIVSNLKIQGAYENTIPIRNLSGGNQQKFVFGRELLRDHRLFLAGYPTRGLDISSIDLIYKKLISNAKERTVLLYSLELNELMAVCNRLAIFYKGKIVKIINPKDYSMNDISKLLIGVK